MTNKHYILVDTLGRIIDGWSDGPTRNKNTVGALMLSENGGYQFRLFAQGEENPALTDEVGAHLWRYENSIVRASTIQEIEQEHTELGAVSKPIPPSNEDRIADLEVALAAVIFGKGGSVNA